jgi:hypothetical protein
MQMPMCILCAQVTVVVVTLGSCTQPPQADLGVALQGIDQARFLACSGPPAWSNLPVAKTACGS